MSLDHGLDRFLSAQEGVYDEVVYELKNGRKVSHWMWFIFPQLAGLGRSETATLYAIRDRDEARQYLHHPVLGDRLLECTKRVLEIEGRSLSAIFGYPDDRKFQSSMTLFSAALSPGSRFRAGTGQVLPG